MLGRLRANSRVQVKQMFCGRASRARLTWFDARAIHGAGLDMLMLEKASIEKSICDAKDILLKSKYSRYVSCF